MLGGTGRDGLAVGRHQVGRYQIVTGQAIGPHEPANPASQGKASNAGVVDRAAGCGQTVHLGLTVKLAPQHATLGMYTPLRGIDANAFHRAQVNHQPAVTGGMASGVVSPPRMATSRSWVRAKVTACTTSAMPVQRAIRAGTFVDHAIPDLAGRFIVCIIGTEQGPLQAVIECLNCRTGDDSLRTSKGEST